MLQTWAWARSTASVPSPFGTGAAFLRPALHRKVAPLLSVHLATWPERPQCLLSPVASAAAAAAAVPAVPAGIDDGSSGPGLWERFSQLSTTLTNFFPIFVLGAAVWALAQPTAFDWFDKAAISPVLALTMLGMGLTLTLDDFKRVFATPGRIFAGFALQYTIMPLLAFLISRLAGLPLAYTIGLCIVGSCPGGTASNVVTYLARADVTLSVAMTTVSTLGAVVATPLLTQLLLGMLVPVDAMALLISTLQVVLAPVLVGAAINSTFPKQVAALAPLCALSAVVLIALICGSVMAQNAAAVVQAGPQLLAAVFALHAGGFFFGYVLSKGLGMPETTARTNSIEVGMQNSALGALLASLHFPTHPVAAVPCAISACMHSILGSLLAAFWRTQSTGEEAVEEIVKPAAAVAIPDAATPAVTSPDVSSPSSHGTSVAAAAEALSGSPQHGCSDVIGFSGAVCSGSASFRHSLSSATRVRSAHKQQAGLFGLRDGGGKSATAPKAGPKVANPLTATDAGVAQATLSQQQLTDLLSTDF